jgi:polysaccharide export outer membrane protein
MLSKLFFLPRIKLAAVLLAGVAGGLLLRAQSPSHDSSWPTPSSVSNRTASAIINATRSYVLDDKHILQPGDIISFQILEDRDPAVQLLVADSRELEVPYLGRISVESKTCQQLAREIKGLLEKEYYYQATVIVGLNLVNKVRGKVYVWGQVQKQGAVDLLFDQKLTAGKAILMAGGFGDFANKKKVKIVRGAQGGAGAAKAFEVNMVEVLENNKTEEDVVLEPDDFIVVAAKAVNF